MSKSKVAQEIIPAPTTSNLPADYAGELAEQIASDLKALKDRVGGPTVQNIRMSGKGFTLPDGQVHSTLRGVIVDFVSANTYYPGVYDKENPASATCFAVHKIIDQMVPHSDAPEPKADSCAECPLNKFESGVGKSKACKNTRKLAIIQENATEESQIWIVTIPPKSLRYFDTYVSTTLSGQHGVTPICAVTEISMDPHEDFAAPRFKFNRLLSEPELMQYYQRRPEAETLLMQPPRTN